MGGGLSAIFGGNNYSSPEPVQYAPAPSTAQSEVEEQSTRDAERKRLRARAGGIRSTLLSTALNGQSATLGRPNDSG